MSYEAREGIDYIVDLYAVAGVEASADASEIKKAITKRLSEWHPDRLTGLAPEIQARGEHMARLLNKARGILSVSEKRAEYDGILSEWTGPVSQTGDPVITISRKVQAEMAMRPIKEVEAIFTDYDQRVDTLAVFSDSRIDLFERMIESSGEDAPVELREQYEAALLEKDRNLSLKEVQRDELLGVESAEDRQYRVSLDYSATVSGDIEVAREVRTEELRAIAAGRVAVRLAILSGEEVPASTELVDPNSLQLPEYFNKYAEEIEKIAQERQGVTEKRLANFQPTYPEIELQAEAKDRVIVGIIDGEDDSASKWFTFVYDGANNAVNAEQTSREIEQLLSTGQYGAVIDAGFNVLTFSTMQHINPRDLLNEALEKYVAKFYPES